MATKRQAPDDHGVRPKRPRYNANPNKPANLSGKSFKKAHPVNELKSQVRSLKRLLERDLPANVRVEKERALQTVTKELEDAEKAKKKSEIIGRWHKVRFFDRQKAERRLKKARKALEGAAGADAELQRQVEDCEVDVNYAMYYPLEVDYVPLFPSKRKKDGEEPENAQADDKAAAREGNQEMWEIVKRCMAEGTLQDLREGGLRALGAEVDQEERASETSTKRNPGKQIRKDTSSKTEQSREEDSDKEHDSADETGRGFFGDD
ncbi:rRNA-processing protein efg1 [Pseudocercospora fuligena]|uniref:rRNA-processing protein EFG1 n=1 Tax=Pseudocercospora fuligena TaxID=685502 RepID=A0A8H6RLA5_9PEZI|nr:rRNA-processing protein efg1 [Pseudocercospora fuligena]